MTSIPQTAPMSPQAVQAARDFVTSLMRFAQVQATACSVDQAMMRRFCGQPVPVRCGLPVQPRPVCTLPTPGFCGTPSVPPFCTPVADPITVTRASDGSRAAIDLGDGYTMTLNEHSSEIVIKDPNGDTTRIWGDPHVDVNGRRVGDFYDTTTFELENGTKITINTEPWRAGGNGAYVASQVVITRGDQGVVVDGISQNDKGDLRITEGLNGHALDLAHDDGFNLTEAGDKASYGWNSEFTGERVTRSEMREMTLHANREMREGLEAERDIGNAFVS